MSGIPLSMQVSCKEQYVEDNYMATHRYKISLRMLKNISTRSIDSNTNPLHILLIVSAHLCVMHSREKSVTFLFGLYIYQTRVCSSRARWFVAPNFCSRATRKSLPFHRNHMLGTLDLTSSEHWSPFNFSLSTALPKICNFYFVFLFAWSAQERIQRICTATERKAGSIQRKFVWKEGWLLWTHCHLSWSKPSHWSGQL